MIEAAGTQNADGTPGSRLVVRGLQKSYGSRKVVRDVSLDVQKGEVVGLLGPNGAGKTTSFYMIVGLVRADAGEITIDGEPIAHMPIHRRARMGLSYLPQEASIFRKLTVEENVRAVLELQREPDASGKPAPLTRQRIEERLSGLWPTCGWTIFAIRPRSRSRAANGAGSRSPARWPRSRVSSCWTSPLPASTRSR